MALRRVVSAAVVSVAALGILGAATPAFADSGAQARLCSPYKTSAERYYDLAAQAEFAGQSKKAAEYYAKGDYMMDKYRRCLA